MASLSQLERRLDRIESRNKRVQLDKSWETSLTRRCLVAVFTYLSIGLYMWAIGVPSPWVNAVVPSIGFLLSTLTLPYFRQLWERYRH